MPSEILQPEPSAALQKAADAFRALGEALDVLAAGMIERADAPPAGPDPLMTVEEAARELKRSPAFVRGQVRRGALRALKDGHGYRLRRSALAAYERRRTA